MSRETEKVLNPEIMKQTQSLVTFEKTDDILQDMRGIIDSSRDAAYRAVNVTLIRRNWLIGYRISEEELSGENRAEYGASVIARLSKELSKEYGKGFTKTNLYSFYSFYKTYPQIFQTPSGIFNMPEYRIHRYCCFRLRTVFACRRRLSCPLRYKLCHSHTSLRYQRGLLYRRLPNQRR